MPIYSKEGLLLLVQVDHQDGELIADAIEHLYKAGAKNVQAISSVTKKGRPSYVLLIDVPPERAEHTEEAIVRELGSSGWHRIETCHRHTAVSVVERRAKVITAQGSFSALMRGKVVNCSMKNVRPEYDDCRALQAMLHDKGLDVPISEIRQSAAEMFRRDEETMYF